jgi:hypothetical protein
MRMKQQASSVLFEYWNEVRGARLAPSRTDIDPSRISAVLPECFIIEHTEEGQFRFRLAGTKICESFGTEFRGQDFLAPWHFDDQAALAAQLSIVMQQGAVALIEFEAWGSRRPVRFEAIFCPLCQSSRIDRLLGTISAISAPDWLGTEPLKKRLLLRHELVWVHREARRAPMAASAPKTPLPVRQARLVRTERRQFLVYDGGLAGPGSRGT